jgi:hypothetical protein
MGGQHRIAELEQAIVDLQHALAARKKKYTEQIQYAARQLKYMKAKFSREAGFRSDLGMIGCYRSPQLEVDRFILSVSKTLRADAHRQLAEQVSLSFGTVSELTISNIDNKRFWHLCRI